MFLCSLMFLTRLVLILSQFGLFLYPYWSANMGPYNWPIRYWSNIGICVICQSDNRPIPINRPINQCDKYSKSFINNYFVSKKMGRTLISDVSSPSLGPPARPSEAFLLGSSPPEARKLQKRESSSPPEARNRYPEPARDTRRFFHTLLEPNHRRWNQKHFLCS